MYDAAREYRMKALFRFFATVAVALTMVPPYFGQQGSASEIHARINSVPTGANVKVDGADVGTTPLEIELPCCFHDVTISKRGFKPWTAMVRNNGHANVTAHLKRREISQAIHEGSISSMRPSDFRLMAAKSWIGSQPKIHRTNYPTPVARRI